MEASLFLGLLGGTLLSSYLLTWTNVGFVLIVSGSIILLAIIYVAIYVEESIDVPEDTTNAVTNSSLLIPILINLIYLILAKD